MASSTSKGQPGSLSGDYPPLSTFSQTLDAAEPLSFADQVSRFRERLRSAGFVIVEETIGEDQADFDWRVDGADPEIELTRSSLIRRASLQMEDDGEMIPVVLDGPAIEALAARKLGKSE